MKNIKVVAIDFDDTLCLTEEACFKAENLVAVKMGHLGVSREHYRKTWGDPMDEAIPKRFPGIDVEKFKEILEETLVEYIENGEFDSISEGNYKVLDELKKRGEKLVIVTSRTEREVKHLIDPQHPLSLRIDAFYHKDSSPFYKPDPRVFSQMLEKFKVESHEAVYIGDSINDAISAKEAGLYFIASLESGLRTKGDFKNVEVDYFINRFSEVLKLVK